MSGRTHADILEEMSALAARLEAGGNLVGAADVRADIASLAAPRPRAVRRCDSCGCVVTSERRAARYDALGVDWLLCSRCES